MNQFAACLGIDWADIKDLCLLDAATGKKTRQVLPHTPQGIVEYFINLRARYPGQQIAVGLEQSRGPLLFALLQYDFWSSIPLTPPPWPGIVKPSRRREPKTIPPTPSMRRVVDATQRPAQGLAS